MLLSVLLIGCGLLRPASCGASPAAPTVTTSSEPSPPQQQQHSSAETVDVGKPATEPQAGVTLDQVIDSISDFQQSTTRAGTAQPLAELAKTLAAIQASVLAISGRLDVIQDSQLQQQKVQADLAKGLNVMEQSQTEAVAVSQASVLEISGRLHAIQDSQLQQQKVQADLAKRLNVMEHSQTEAVSHLQSQVFNRFDIIQQSQSQMSSRLDDLAQSQNVASGRLDDLAQSQNVASGRLDNLVQSQNVASGRLDDLAQSQNAASGRLDIIQSTLSLLDGLQQNQTEAVGRLVEVREAQSTLSSTLPARLGVIETSLGTLSGRVDTVLQQRQQQAAVISTPTAAQERLDAILAAVSRIPKTVLGTSCASDTDCSRLLPEATCGDGGLCSCRDGYRQVSDTVCRRLPRLTEPCLEEADCQAVVANATCTGGVCVCGGRFWNYNNAECRQVSAVALNGSCVDDQDCVSNPRLWCVSGTCSCPSKMIGNEEYRLVGGSSCTEGNVQLRRRGGYWGVVCDDDWDATDASVLCRSLDFRTGTPTAGSAFGRATNFYMDNVKCTGSETRLAACPYLGWGSHNCGSGEVAGVRCR